MYRDALKFIEHLNSMAEYERETVARAAAISSGASLNASAMFTSGGLSSSSLGFKRTSTRTFSSSSSRTASASASSSFGSRATSAWTPPSFKERREIDMDAMITDMTEGAAGMTEGAAGMTSGTTESTSQTDSSTSMTTSSSNGSTTESSSSSSHSSSSSSSGSITETSASAQAIKGTGVGGEVKLEGLTELEQEQLLRGESISVSGLIRQDISEALYIFNENMSWRLDYLGRFLLTQGIMVSLNKKVVMMQEQNENLEEIIAKAMEVQIAASADKDLQE